MNKIFLSHNSIDKPFVRKLAADLKRNKIYSWIDEAEIQVGDSLLEKIEEGIEQSDYVAAVLSNSSVKSEWVKRELEIALNEEIENKKTRVLPLLIEDCRIPSFLKGKLYADFRSSYTNGLNSLVNKLAPKKSFTPYVSSKDKIKGKENILLAFKDEDYPVLKKKVNSTFTIGEIRKSNPVTKSLWVDIFFDKIPLLERVELFSYKQNSIRLSYMVDLGKLVNQEIDKKTWNEQVEAFGNEIWKRDEEIMSILETKDLAVNWGGPKTEHISAEGEILYYFDNSFGYVMAQKQTKRKSEIDKIQLEQIYGKASKFSSIVKKIIAKTKSVK